MASDDLSADSNTLVAYKDIDFNVPQIGSGVGVLRYSMVYVQVTADDTGDYVDLDDHMPSNVTILCDLGRAGASAQDGTYVTWSNDRVTFANNASTEEINRVVLLVQYD